MAAQLSALFAEEGQEEEAARSQREAADAAAFATRLRAALGAGPAR